MTRLLTALLATSGLALSVEAQTVTNPLLPRWSGPYGGVPPFDQVKVEHFKPALEAAMAEQLAETDRIANDPSPPTFANTIEAMEKSGRAMTRVTSVYRVFSSTMRSAPFREVEREMEPKLSAFRDRIIQNEALFKRISAVYEARGRSGLTTEQREYHHDLPASAALLEQVVRVRRLSNDWRLLGANYGDQNKADQALSAFQHALTIRPDEFRTHLGLAESYRRLSDTVRMKDHRDKAEWLRLHQQD